MDNKKWYKKIATIFWWTMTALPVVITLIHFVGYHLTFNSGIATATELSTYQDLSNGDFLVILENYLNNFDNFTMVGLKNTFSGLFNILGITSYNTFAILFAYMLSIQLYHLMFDFLVFFPHLIHCYLDEERWFKL